MPFAYGEARNELIEVTQTKGGAVFEISAKPRSREFRIKVQGSEITVSCKEEPVKGKVNKELVKEFTRLFRKETVLISGFTSKEKRLLIKNANADEVERVLLHFSLES